MSLKHASQLREAFQPVGERSLGRTGLVDSTPVGMSAA